MTIVDHEQGIVVSLETLNYTRKDSRRALRMTRNTSSEGVLTLAKVAAYLKVTERAIYRLAGAKKITAFKVGGGWRFRKTDIDAWINSLSLDKEGRES